MRMKSISKMVSYSFSRFLLYAFRGLFFELGLTHPPTVGESGMGAVNDEIYIRSRCYLANDSMILNI